MIRFTSVDEDESIEVALVTAFNGLASAPGRIQEGLDLGLRIGLSTTPSFRVLEFNSVSALVEGTNYRPTVARFFKAPGQPFRLVQVRQHEGRFELSRISSGVGVELAADALIRLADAAAPLGDATLELTEARSEGFLAWRLNFILERRFWPIDPEQHDLGPQTLYTAEALSRHFAGPL